MGQLLRSYKRNIERSRVERCSSADSLHMAYTRSYEARGARTFFGHDKHRRHRNKNNYYIDNVRIIMLYIFFNTLIIEETRDVTIQRKCNQRSKQMKRGRMGQAYPRRK